MFKLLQIRLQIGGKDVYTVNRVNTDCYVSHYSI